MVAAQWLTFRQTHQHAKRHELDELLLEVKKSCRVYPALTSDSKLNELRLELATLNAMRQKAKAPATRFSDEAFDKSLERVLSLLYC
mmetsp:Transcript_14385/g.22163  ORF Transcript_14385/g.22163 Transcript_14385/m.22163 type:complete len:87 (+) Transcript_14385:762-1022(+)